MSSGLALGYAVLLFGIGMLVESRLRPRKWITFLAERGYESYLLHGVVLFPAIDLLGRRLPFRYALPIAVLLTIGAVELVYRLVDRPSRRLVARRIRVLSPTQIGKGGNGGVVPGEDIFDASVLIEGEACP